MIEIHTDALLSMMLLLVIMLFSGVLWATLWSLLAFTFEYPKNPSWRTAVPAALPFLILLLVLLKVIVFV
jgi:hypothetical protein